MSAMRGVLYDVDQRIPIHEKCLETLGSGEWFAVGCEGRLKSKKPDSGACTEDNGCR